tara:strand:+ start:296 stop:1330 length:1035 start_codon:yes stop_codon:yes gene_type:complete
MEIAQHFSKVTHAKKDIVSNWISDDDFDDFFELYGIYKIPKYNTRYQLKKNAKTMNYKIMNSLLLHSKINSSLEDFLDEDLIVEFLEESDSHRDGKDKTRLSPLIQQVRNIQYLYDILNNWKMDARKMNITLPIVIYRGFQENRHHQYFKHIKSDKGNSLQDIKTNDVVTIPTFLSTSITRNVALTFVSQGYYLWEIIVPKDKLAIFQYVYLGHTVNLQDIDGFSESEILLNVGTKLRFIKSTEEKNHVFISDAAGKATMHIKKTIVQTYEFIGYDKEVDLSHLEDYLREDKEEEEEKSGKRRRVGSSRKQKKSRKRKKSKKRKRKKSKRKKSKKRKKKRSKKR